jgi:SAM-dependent methyltransferase
MNDDAMKRDDRAGAVATSTASGRFFEAIAGRYDRVYGLPPDQSRARMARVVRELPPPPARILDLGVGTGRELPALIDAGHAPTGLDSSPAMLARCARRSRPVPLVQADFWQPLPFLDGAFDAAVALHGTLAHAPDRATLAGLAREVARVVREGGVWVVEVPAPLWLERLDAAPLGPGVGPLARRTGPGRGVYIDPVVGAEIGILVLSADEWRAALGQHWAARVEPLGEVEWLVVATRAE